MVELPLDLPLGIDIVSVADIGAAPAARCKQARLNPDQAEDVRAWACLPLLQAINAVEETR